MHFAERLAHRAQRGLIAARVLREALGQDNGAVDGSHDLQCVDVLGVPRKPVAAVGALLGNEQTAPGQFLQDLRKQRQGNPVSLGDVLSRRTRPRTELGLRGRHRQMAQRDQPIVRLLGQLQHPT